MPKPRIFIDGEAGTTGLEIRKRLEARKDVELISISFDKRKDQSERKKLLNVCDLTVLCLPDEAARDAVSLIENPMVRVLDASTAHRTSSGWVYGFPEISPDQARKIAEAKYVSNPGCYPTGALALIRPLVDMGLIPKTYTVSINAISGYSGGGKELIAQCESPDANDRPAAFCLYGLDQQHKHIPEMRVHSGLIWDPLFLPSYSSAYYRGMLVMVALNLKELEKVNGQVTNGKRIHQVLSERYKGCKYVWVEPLQEKLEKGYVLTPLAQNLTNNLQLRVFANEEKGTAILTSCLDNLGKGASGAAVQNVELMLGLAG